MKFRLNAITKDGFPIQFEGEVETDLMGSLNLVTDPDFGYSAPMAASRVTAVTSNDPLACQFCGKEVKPVKYGNKSYTADEVAKSRAEKMGKMGRGEARPVCGDCWTSGGHNKAWDAWYQANR